MDFAVPADHRVKWKESEKKNEYVDLTRELIKIVEHESDIIGTLGTVIKELIKGLEELEIKGRVETIQTAALMRSTRILRRVLKTWPDLLSLRL